MCNAPKAAFLRHRHRRMQGITLLELMVVVSIVAILLGVATSSYKSITTSSRMTNEVNGLLGDMQYARSEAIKQGLNVVVCVSTTGTDCATGNFNWNLGWIVFVNNASPPSTGNNAALVLRAQPAFKGTDTLTDGATSYVSYDREGLSVGFAGTVIPLHDAASTASRTRCLQITAIGSTTVQTPTSLPGTCT